MRMLNTRLEKRGCLPDLPRPISCLITLVCHYIKAHKTEATYGIPRFANRTSQPTSVPTSVSARTDDL